MSRHQCNLYVNNIADQTTEQRLVGFFSKFGAIESYTFMPKSFHRSTTAAIFTYAKLDDVNSILERRLQHFLDGHTLLVRRTMPEDRPAFERFMQTNELLISLDRPCYDENFNAVNIRKYFGAYGSIVSCRPVIVEKAFLIDFVESDSVDRAILDEPHFYNENRLTIRKYIVPERVRSFMSKKTTKNCANIDIHFYLFDRIRRIKHASEALAFGEQVQLELAKCSFDEQQLKQVKEKYQKAQEALIRLEKTQTEMRASMEQMKLESERLRTVIEQNRQIKKDLSASYAAKIDEQCRRTTELTEALEVLRVYMD